ncbi:hypothetical protein ACFVTE_11640 [Arthrobacter sp. NPDC058097]|uniref:hypothetical protein n=1 Tax=Arthrobacter sp. NPDC058097 TaxID=3346340 RepID=UPI0036DC5DA9
MTSPAIPAFKDRNLFFAFSTFTGERAAFDKWYDEEHIPQVTDSTGMIGAQRFVVADTKPLNGTAPLDFGHLAMYEIDGSPASFREEVKQMLLTGQMQLPDLLNQPFTALFLEPVSAMHYGDAYSSLESLDERNLWLVWCRPPADAEGRSTFNKWYDEEHIPQVLSAPGLVRAQRFELNSAVKPLPGVFTPDLGHLALYETAGDPTLLREEVKRMLMSGEMVLPDFIKQVFDAMFMKPVSPFFPAHGASSGG